MIFSVSEHVRLRHTLSSLAQGCVETSTVDSRHFESGKVIGPAAKRNKNKLEALAHMWGNTGLGRRQFVCVNDGGWGKTFIALIGHTCPGRSSRTNALRFLSRQPGGNSVLQQGGAGTWGSKPSASRTAVSSDTTNTKYNIHPCFQNHTQCIHAASSVKHAMFAQLSQPRCGQFSF